MIKGMEKMVNFFSNVIFYASAKKEQNVNKSKGVCVLSSVFPSTRVMKEVEKHI